MRFADITETIIKAFYIVYNALGPDMSETMYVRALTIELERDGLLIDRELPIRVFYRGEAVGDFRIDLVVNMQILVECKVARALTPAHRLQLLRYLRATGMPVGLLLNFGPDPEVGRVENHRLLRESEDIVEFRVRGER